MSTEIRSAVVTACSSTEPRAVHLSFPLVHSNGDARQTLVDSYADSYKAVMDAREIVANFGPDARNFYPLGGRAFDVAREQHRRRLELLDAIADDLLALAVHCSESGN